MAYFSDKAAAIRNMINDLNIKEDNPQGLILSAISDLLSEICESLAFLDDDDINVIYDDAPCGGITLICPGCGQTVPVDERQIENEGVIHCHECGETVIISTSGQ